MMKTGLRGITKGWGWIPIYGLSYLKARRLFERSSEAPSWVDVEVLCSLQKQYPFITSYKYDPTSVAIRGRERAEELLGFVKGKSDVKRFLELACSDGMICYYLSESGKLSTAIDASTIKLDDRITQNGVEFFKMDAEKLEFDDESFDFVFSYNAFEHFQDPAQVLAEMLRVVKAGGYIYLSFNPLFMSPFGLHAYWSLTVPYCHYLFERDLMEEYTDQNGLRPIRFYDVNRWTLEQYDVLWDRYSQQLNKIYYSETINAQNLDLVCSYPSCFKSKTNRFRELIVSGLEVLFRKRIV